MGHDKVLLALAIESILADCGRLGTSWGMPPSKEKPAGRPSPAPAESWSDAWSWAAHAASLDLASAGVVMQ